MKNNSIFVFIIAAVLLEFSCFALVVQEDILLELNAAWPGYSTDTKWMPVVGLVDGGDIMQYAQNFWVADPEDFTPVLLSESAENPESPQLNRWFYRFKSDVITLSRSIYGGGTIENLGTDSIKDYNEDFSVEAWVRPGSPDCIEGSCGWAPDSWYGGMYIFGSMNLYENGYNLKLTQNQNLTQGITHPGTPLKVSFQMRDSYTPIKMIFRAETTGYVVPLGQWTHIIATYNGNDNAQPVIKLYINGTAASYNQICQGGYEYSCTDFSDADFMYEAAAIVGGRDWTDYEVAQRQWFTGDISVIRVYDRPLDAQEVSELYVLGLPERESVQPQAATDGLVLYMDAADPGALPYSAWKPVIGNQSGGDLVGVCAGQYGNSDNFKPSLLSENAGDENDISLRNWFYRFSPVKFSSTESAGGYVVNLGDDILFDYDDTFTVDAWVRPAAPACMDDPDNCSWVSPATYGQMNLIGQFSNTWETDNGWRLVVQKPQNLLTPGDTRPGQPCRFYTEMKDRQGSIKHEYNCRTPDAMPIGKWHYITAVYQGQSQSQPTMKLYVDGQLQQTTYTCSYDCSTFSEANFIDNVLASIGGRDWPNRDFTQRAWFIGDISLIRVYERALSQLEIRDNMAAGMTKRFVWGDTNQDLQVDSYDFAGFASSWQSQFGDVQHKQTSDMDCDCDVDFEDLVEFSNNWLIEP